MNKAVFYDNQANAIDWIKNDKPKIKVMKKDNKLDVRELSNDELLEKITETQIKREELTIMYNMTKSESTLVQVSKITSFISVMRAEVRKRKMHTYENLKSQIISLESQLIEIKNDRKPVVSDKSIKFLNNVNENLKNEVKALKEKIEKKDEQISSLKLEIAKKDKCLKDNKEAEKTKRHIINIKNDKFAFEYVKNYLSQVISKEEMDGVNNDLHEMRINEEKQLNENTPQ